MRPMRLRLTGVSVHGEFVVLVNGEPVLLSDLEHEQGIELPRPIEAVSAFEIRVLRQREREHLPERPE